MEKEISNRSQTNYFLKKYDISLKKSLGQNFLIEPKILDKIVNAADVDINTGIIEIGPGIGALTEKLAKKAGKVLAIEIDQRLIPVLSESLADYENVKIVHGDVLKTDIAELIKEEFADYKSLKVVANLPYYITSPIILKLLEEKLPLESITIMVQQEVAKRISAKPGGKEFGSLSLVVDYYAEASIAFDVPSSVFVPKPNVDSAILQLKVRQKPQHQVENEELMFKVIRASFAQRRKTIFNNLINNLAGKENKAEIEAVLTKSNIDPQRRAETLSLADFVKLSNNLGNVSFH